MALFRPLLMYSHSPNWYLQYGKKLLNAYKLSDWKLIHKPLLNYNGLCWFNKKKIEINSTLLEKASHEYIIEIIKHEVAHAIAGPTKDYHGKKWRNIFLSLGGSGQIYYGSITTPSKYILKCQCGNSWDRNKKTNKTYYCPECKSTLIWEIRKSNKLV